MAFKHPGAVGKKLKQHAHHPTDDVVDQFSDGEKPIDCQKQENIQEKGDPPEQQVHQYLLVLPVEGFKDAKQGQMHHSVENILFHPLLTSFP